MITAKSAEIIPLAEEGGSAHGRSKTAILTRSQQLTIFHCLLIVAVAFVGTRVMWAPALLYGHSAWFDLTRMVEFDAAIRAGDYWPTWSPDLYHGYGSPLFQFYAPLVYFITEIPVLSGMDIASALKVTQLSMLIASGLAMYLFAANHVSRWAACFGAVLYMIAPYRFVDLFMRHALAEHAAFLWLPLIAWGTERFVRQNSRAGLITGILATAGLILTHNVMALIGLPVCVALAWILSERPSWRALIPALIGVGLAAFFWWPALSGRALTQAEESLTSGHFDYHQHFVSAWNFVDPGWEFGETDAIPMQTGLVHLLLAAGAVALIFSKSRTRWSMAGVVITLGAIAMCHSASRFVWEILPLVKYVQFPWRFLALVVFGSALCGAALLNCLRSVSPRWEVPVFFAALLAVMATYLPCYTNARFLAADSLTNSFTHSTPAEVETMRARGTLLPMDRIATPAMIRSVGERATSGDDFLPRGVQEKPATAALQTFVVTNGELKQWDRPAFNTYRATIAMPAAGKVELNQFCFPGWNASLDQRPIAITPSGKAAIVSCDVPAGDHTIEFRYSSLPQRRTGATISSLSVLAAAVLIFLGQSQRKFSEGVAL